jgi:hypothetical protein
MPALPIVPGVIRFAIEGTDDACHWANVVHFRYAGTAPTSANLVAFNSTMLTAWGANLGPLQKATCFVTAVRSVDLASLTGAVGDFEDTVAGTRAGARVPGSAALLIHKSVSLRYRGGHARTYLCAGVDEDLEDASHWTGALVAAGTGAWQSLQAAMVGQVQGGTTLGTECAVSYVSKTANPVSPFRRAVPLVLDIASVAARALIASQRRRLGKV